MSFQSVPPETEADRKRFDALCEIQPNGCIIRTGFVYGKGYAGFTIGYTNYRAHRVAYVWAYGEPNADLHHTCENRRCVNPEHIVVAAAGQPHHRGPSPNFCAHGHEFTDDNTYINPRGERQCRQCLRAATARHRDRNRDRINELRRQRRVRVVHEPRECAASDCHNSFTPIRSDKRFCSGACYQRAKYHGEV